MTVGGTQMSVTQSVTPQRCGLSLPLLCRLVNGLLVTRAELDDYGRVGRVSDDGFRGESGRLEILRSRSWIGGSADLAEQRALYELGHGPAELRRRR